jgi:hypothetical protein
MASTKPKSFIGRLKELQLPPKDTPQTLSSPVCNPKRKLEDELEDLSYCQRMLDEAIDYYPPSRGEEKEEKKPKEKKVCQEKDIRMVLYLEFIPEEPQREFGRWTRKQKK